MSIETWLAFAAASTVLLVIPGPTILLVISYALGQGMRTALPVAVGVAHGDFWTQMLIFETTFLALAFANAVGYGLVASRARRLVGNARAIGIFNRIGGTLLIGAGIAAASMRVSQ